MENKNQPEMEKTTQLSPDELENVTGGELGMKRSENCWFKPSGAIKVIDGNTWYKCTENCRAFIPVVHGFIQCHCHGKDDQCKDRFHYIDNKENCGWNKYLN